MLSPSLIILKIQRANSVDLDEVAHYEPSHQDLHSLQIQLFSSLVLALSMTSVKSTFNPTAVSRVPDKQKLLRVNFETLFIRCFGSQNIHVHFC